MNQENLRKFEGLLRKNRRSTGAEFSDLELERLKSYYELVLKWNARLHLTTLTTPSEFFLRHIYESDFAETFILPSIDQIWDLGTGLGVPGIPLAILRPELIVNLVESKRGKVVFLEEAVSALKLTNVKVVGARIESIGQLPVNSCLIARAVEKMESIILEMMALGRNCRQIVVLGAEELGDKFRDFSESEFCISIAPIPGSERRYIINVLSST